MHPVKTHVAQTSTPGEFLGFVLRPGGRRRLPETNVRRFRNRLRGLRDRWRAGTVSRAEVEQRVGAWVAHAAHADTWRLRRAIFRDGCGSHRARNPSRGPDRPPAAAWFAVVPGTTMRSISVLARATGTAPAIGTTTAVFALRARPEAGAGAVTTASGARGSVQGRS